MEGIKQLYPKIYRLSGKWGLTFFFSFEKETIYELWATYATQLSGVYFNTSLKSKILTLESCLANLANGIAEIANSETVVSFCMVLNLWASEQRYV